MPCLLRTNELALVQTPLALITSQAQDAPSAATGQSRGSLSLVPYIPGIPTQFVHKRRFADRIGTIDEALHVLDGAIESDTLEVH